jgi:biotin transport system substrate-specific component
MMPPIAVAATIFIAICAHFSLPLPFTPVPITLENFAVLMVGLLMGPRMGFFTLCTYLLEGAAGLPVFSPHGLGGVAQLLGPTGGYLLSYPVTAAISGWGAATLKKRMPSFVAAYIAISVATVFTFACGAAWMRLEFHFAPAAIWATAVAPFLLGEFLKMGAAASLYSGWQRWRSR